MKTENADGVGMIPPPPLGKNIWGTVTLGDRGQLVIPKNVRDQFGLKGGDRLIVLSDEHGIALLPAAFFESKMKEMMSLIS
jgi:AbrB family looped-hinge helix DNA binding protein